MSKLSGWIKSAEKAVSNAIPHQHSADRRASMNAVNEQITFYQQQRQMMESEAATAQADKDLQRQKINEKQIRNMRRGYRAPGFMDESGEGTSQTLG